MVRLRYYPNCYDLKKGQVELLRVIFNFNTHKHEQVDCIVFDELCIKIARTKWQPDFVDFDFAIEKL